MSQLIASHLSKHYAQRPIVQDISIEVTSGTVVGLLGPNGAGKTTMFYMISGASHPNHGQLFLDQTEISHLPMYKRAQMGIRYLPQEPSIFRKLTVLENLMGVAELTSLSKQQQQDRVQSLLEEMKLSHLSSQKAYTLSGGERRRLEIARMLVTLPKFLLMDEPFSGVDPISIQDLQHIISTLKDKNIGILITDHNVRETLKIVDKAYLIHGGKIIYSGNNEDLLKDRDSRKYYLGEHYEN